MVLLLRSFVLPQRPDCNHSPRQNNSINNHDKMSITFLKSFDESLALPPTFLSGSTRMHNFAPPADPDHIIPVYVPDRSALDRYLTKADTFLRFDLATQDYSLTECEVSTTKNHMRATNSMEVFLALVSYLEVPVLAAIRAKYPRRLLQHSSASHLKPYIVEATYKLKHVTDGSEEELVAVLSICREEIVVKDDGFVTGWMVEQEKAKGHKCLVVCDVENFVLFVEDNVVVVPRAQWRKALLGLLLVACEQQENIWAEL